MKSQGRTGLTRQARVRGQRRTREGERVEKKRGERRERDGGEWNVKTRRGSDGSSSGDLVAVGGETGGNALKLAGMRNGDRLTQHGAGK